MLTTSLQSTVGFYRKYLSQHKGFKCAYAADKGRLSCSDWAAKVLARKGGLQFLIWLPRRLTACQHAYVRRTSMLGSTTLFAQSLATNSGEVPPSHTKENGTDFDKRCGYPSKYCGAEIGATCCLPFLFS